MARQYAKSAAVRRTIIESCSETFQESGFRGVSMAEIARRAGISHTGLLHHFPRKEALLTAVLQLQDERGEQFLREHSTLSPEIDPVAILRGMVATLVERDRYAGLVELSATLGGEATTPGHPAHDYFAARYHDVRSFLTRLFTALRNEDRLRSSLSPAHLAAMTLAATDGLNTQWLYARDEIDVDAIVHAFLASVVKGLGDQLPE
jgi:AcrR family transcriptional regulator